MGYVVRTRLPAVAALVLLGAFAPGAAAAGNEAAALKRELGPDVRVAEHRETGKVRFLGTRPGRPIARARGVGASAPPGRIARAFFDRYGDAFGVRDQERELRQTSSEQAPAGRSVVRFLQQHGGVPVVGAELVVNLDAHGNVLSASGEALPDPRVVAAPRVGSAAARDVAVAAVAKQYGVAASRLDATLPSPWIYDAGILGGPGPDSPVLVWRLEVTGEDGLPIDELVLIDAQRGSVALRITQIEHALNRQVCDGNSSTAQYPCTAPVRIENGPASGIADVNLAYDFSGDTYNFFAGLGRDSVDGAGLTLKSTVRHCPSPAQCPYQNAFWDGQQMVYGAGYAAADDVVGHELTHGVTDFSAHLFYYFQSGAINESLSDVFGEFVDLTNGAGTDTAAARWLIGEDLPGGRIRDMEEPGSTPSPDPDRMTSPNYNPDTNETDFGGVHTNSGVNNKAAFLMTDGGTFNGRTVTSLGIPKVSRIYYAAQTGMLTSGSDYADLNSALPQACTNLIGTAGITAADCAEVTDAVAAVEMGTVPPAAPTLDAPTCASGQVPTNLYFDNLENTASGNWSAQSGWYYPQNPNPVQDNTYATSGARNFWGDQSPTGDSSIAMTSSVAIPAGSTAFLRFNHAYGFEASGGNNWDGGMLEYSTNNGLNWNDAGSLLTEGGYDGTLSTASNNPLEGRSAFVQESNGYTSGRAALASLGGQSVRFRFRLSNDSTIRDDGWFVDDVRIYTCAAPPAAAGGGGTLAGGPGPAAPAPTLRTVRVRSCRRTGRARRARVTCTLSRFAAVRRATIRVTRRGRTFARGSGRPTRSGRVAIRPRRVLRRGTYRVTITLRDARGATRRLTARLRV